MVEIILTLGAGAILAAAYFIGAIIYYPFDPDKNGATLAQYIKELF